MALPNDSKFGGEHTCGNCVRHYEVDEEDFVACGAGSDECAIWAIRKYSLIGIRDAIAYGNSNEYLGQNCDRMRRDDGIDCPAFIPGKDNYDGTDEG